MDMTQTNRTDEVRNICSQIGYEMIGELDADEATKQIIEIITQVRLEATNVERERCALVAHSFRRGNLSVGKLQDLLKTEPTAPAHILPDGTIEGHDPAIAIATAIRQTPTQEGV